MSEPTKPAARRPPRPDRRSAARRRPRPRRPPDPRSTSPTSRSRAARRAGPQRREDRRLAKLLKLQVDLGDETAPDRGRHRRRLRAGGAGRQEDRARREPQAGEADGRGVQRHGAGRLRRRQAPSCARSTRTSPRARRSSSDAEEGAACARRPGWPWPPLPPPAALGCPSAAREVVYDLAERAALRGALVVARGAALRHARRRAAAGGRLLPRGRARARAIRSCGRKGEAELALDLAARRAARFAVVDLAPYKGVKGQTAEVRLNGSPVARFTLNDARYRYGFALPAAAQRAGDNRLRFVFAATASPADDGRRTRTGASSRPRSTASSSATPRDPGPAGPARPRRAAAVRGRAGRTACPRSSRSGRASCATRSALPAARRAALHARLHAGRARRRRLRVVPRHARKRGRARSRSCGRAVLGPQSARAGGGPASRCRGEGGRHRPPRPARRAGGPTGERFAWGLWGAPRVMGRAGAPTPAAPRAARRPTRSGAAWTALRAGARRRQRPLRRSSTPDAPTTSAPTATRAPTTPNIDRFAREGVVFERAFTPAVYTLGAMSSVWTSQYPDRHHADVSFAARLPKDRLTLAELLGAQGIHTAGLRGQRDRRRPSTASTAGSRSSTRSSASSPRAPRDGFARTVPAWIARADRDARFFAYVHFREPHFPYDPPPPFDTRFGPDGPITKAAQPRRPAPGSRDVNQGRRPSTRRGEATTSCASTTATSPSRTRRWGRSARRSRRRACSRRTVVIVSADHGEALFEHGWIGHNVQLYDESMHVPLIVRFPGGPGAAGGDAAGRAGRPPRRRAHDRRPVRGDGPRRLRPRSSRGAACSPRSRARPGETAILSRTVWDRPRYALPRRGLQVHLRHAHGRRGALRPRARIPGRRRTSSRADPLRAAWSRQALHHWIAPRRARPPRGRSPPPRLTARAVREPEGARLPPVEHEVRVRPPL